MALLAFVPGCGNDATASPKPSSAPAHHPSATHEPAHTAPEEWPSALPRDLALEGPLPLGRPVVVYLDAGHGAKDNPGNTSSFGVEEQDFTLGLADDVAAELERTGRFAIVDARQGDARVAYADRVADAAAAHADVFVSLHSDVRGKTEAWSPAPDTSCLRSFDAPGFSVLWSDEGDASLAARRLGLAASIAASMQDAGWIPYDGAEYVGLYEGSGEGTGVFVDRHLMQKRIFVLRRTTMPAVIVETHNALDPREAEAFEEPTVRRAFAFALGKGVEDALAGRAPPLPMPAPSGTSGQARSID
ncbi:MAG TPA: N-acetylmuramoyl-L-alanine amidase, partial [Polyangiaceae bacterium]|nr:N-acetylmuramoyl-L-alanine amidase [Polyangiaceae bacterium]